MSMEKKKYQKGTKELISRDYDWELIFWNNPEGEQLFSLNKLKDGRRVATITCNLKQLKNLKRFMRERKFR